MTPYTYTLYALRVIVVLLSFQFVGVKNVNVRKNKDTNLLHFLYNKILLSFSKSKKLLARKTTLADTKAWYREKGLVPSR